MFTTGSVVGFVVDEVETSFRLFRERLSTPVENLALCQRRPKLNQLSPAEYEALRG
jgi:hypothetical protein